MSAGIAATFRLSRTVLAASSEPQLLYLLLETSLEQQQQLQGSRLPLNLCLLIDRSSSMMGEPLAHVKQAALKLIDQLDPDDTFALVTFNDRGQVVVPMQSLAQRNEIKRAINSIEASGGTELARGLAAAIHEIADAPHRTSINHLVLLTDGRTYGDEDQCVALVRRAAQRSIGLTALGLGGDWNDTLLEAMAKDANGQVRYISAPGQIVTVFDDVVSDIHSIVAQQVRLRISTSPGGAVRAIDRVQPFIAPVALEPDGDGRYSAVLGNWSSTGHHTYLIEMLVPPLPIGPAPCLSWALSGTLPNAGRAALGTGSIGVYAAPAAPAAARVDGTVKYWLERVVANRLQMSAWEQVENGMLEAAAARLQMAGTRLLGTGEFDMARTVRLEAARIRAGYEVTAEDRKRIKFGTRGLMDSTASPMP